MQLFCHECKQGCCSETGVHPRASILLSVITPLTVAVRVQRGTFAVKTPLIKFVVVKVPRCIPAGPQLHIIVTGCGIPRQYLNFRVIYGRGAAVLSLVKFCGHSPDYLTGRQVAKASLRDRLYRHKLFHVLRELLPTRKLFQIKQRPV